MKSVNIRNSSMPMKREDGAKTGKLTVLETSALFLVIFTKEERKFKDPSISSVSPNPWTSVGIWPEERLPHQALIQFKPTHFKVPPINFLTANRNFALGQNSQLVPIDLKWISTSGWGKGVSLYDVSPLVHSFFLYSLFCFSTWITEHSKSFISRWHANSCSQDLRLDWFWRCWYRLTWAKGLCFPAWTHSLFFSFPSDVFIQCLFHKWKDSILTEWLSALWSKSWFIHVCI